METMEAATARNGGMEAAAVVMEPGSRLDTTMDSTIATCAPFLVAHGLLLLHPLDLHAQLPLLSSEQ